MHSGKTKLPKPTLRQTVIMVTLALIQAAFWYQVRLIRPDLGIVPPVPSEREVQALSFGDSQLYFRVRALELQNAGDTYGRFSSLRYYDMGKLYLWFTLMDRLDRRSNMMPSMATYYFSQTQNTPDVRYIVNYLYEHATRDIEHKWWWLVQAIYLAQHRLNDLDLAKKVAMPLVNSKVPVWAQQMAAVVSEKRGEMDDALAIMETIKNNAETIPEADLKYMTYFIKERLKRLEKLEEFEHVKTTPNRPPSNAPY